MKLNKPKFWEKKNSVLSIILFPISLIIILLVFLKKKTTRAQRFNIPIICVGNIYIGGTGKTPTSIYLANALKQMSKNPAILKKYYKNQNDEHNLIKEHFKNLIICRDRVEGIKQAGINNFDSIILDDGFQDYRIQADLNILCFNQNQLIGNGLVLPAGPLRENLSSLKNANIIIINGEKNLEFEKKILNINYNLEIFYSHYNPINIDKFKNKNLLAIAGIGNPDNFFQLLSKNNLNIEKKLFFPDHYEFTKKEIENIVEEANKRNQQIIMTEKDYFRIKNFNINNIEYLKVSLIIDKKEKFLQAITKLYDQKI